MAALRGVKTINPIAQDEGVLTVQVSAWKKELQEGLPSVFQSAAKHRLDEEKAGPSWSASTKNSTAGDLGISTRQPPVSRNRKPDLPRLFETMKTTTGKLTTGTLRCDELGHRRFSRRNPVTHSHPFLFVGSGFTHRYLGTDDWKGLIGHFAKQAKYEVEFAFEWYQNEVARALANLLACAALVVLRLGSMNIRVSSLAVVALGFGACKHQDSAAPVADQGVAAPAAAPAAVAQVPMRSVEDRAAKLGFMRYLLPDTEIVIQFQQGAKSADRITSSQLWKLAQLQMGMSPGGAPAAGRPPSLFGLEMTMALGKSVGEQVGHLQTLNGRREYFQMRMLAKAFCAAAKSGDFTGMQHALANQYGQELAKDLLADPESGVGLIERLQMPPVYLAFRAGDAERAGAAQQLAAMVANLGMLGPMVEPLEIEVNGQKFAGHKIRGAKIAEQMEAGRKEMDGMLDPAAVDQLLAAIAKKDLVVVSGIVGDYAILFIGSSPDDLKIAASPAESLVAGEPLAFSDAYAAKELAAVVYSQQSSLDRLNAGAGILAEMAGGLRDGLAGSEGLGDTRDLEALLRMVGERDAALLKLVGNDTLGMVAFFEDGLKIESYGGRDNGAIDWQAPNQLAALGDRPEVVMFANLTTAGAYHETAHGYLAALIETSYAMTMKIAEIKVDDPQMNQYATMAKTFDSHLRSDAVALWDACGGGGLGRERAWVVDLKGGLPAIPGLPQTVVDQGKFPRISVLAPVTDRSKLAASWQQMNASLTKILCHLGELTGKEIPMQKPVSSEKDGYSTWFFPLPFCSDDFMPSVTVDDHWFAASTSKNQALDLVHQAAKGGSTRTGLEFSMNFKALQMFARDTLKVVEDNPTAIFHDGAVPTDRIASLRKFADALDDLDQLTVHARREGGVLRSTIHLKTR